MSTLTTTTTTTTTHQLSFNKKRVLLRRATQQINDPIVIKQKYKAKKSVRFSDKEDEVKYFYKSHTPLQIHQDVPYMEYSVEDYKVIQPNWPARNMQSFLNDNHKIRMENVQLLDGDYDFMKKNQFLLEGRCKVLSMASENKTVHIRYTMDLWKSYQEVQATTTTTNTTWDRFYFNIPIDATLETKTIYMALRYTVNGQDYWDNNTGKNYEIIIKPNEQQQPKKEDIKVLAKRYDFTASLSAISPPPSPPRTPTDDDDIIYTPPIFFNHLPKTTTQKIPSPTQPIDQLSYTDFVNKYCFYNSHSTPATTPTPIYYTVLS